MTTKEIKSYYYFTGENIDGDLIEGSTSVAMTDENMRDYARAILREYGGGHLDVWYSETDEFAFDMEV